MDDLVAQVAAGQYNRISRLQLCELGLSANAIKHRVSSGRYVIVEEGVFAIAPVLDHDPRGRWMAATLTQPGSTLSHLSSAVARGVLSFEGPFVTITRAGNGGTRRQGGMLIHHSTLLEGEITDLDGIPITTMERTLLDIAGEQSGPALARAVREAVRLAHTTLRRLGDAFGRYRGRRGIRALAATVARYSGLPLERARSGAEIRAMEILRDEGKPTPRLNVRVAGEEADLSWPGWRLVVEIDGPPFHRDVGEDARKERVWREAGWTVRRLPSDDVYERPWRLLDVALPPNVQIGSP